MTITPLSILDPITQDQLRQVLIGYLDAANDPVTFWGSGGVRRTQLEYSALTLNDLLANAVPGLAGAPNFGTAPDDDWIELIAAQLFQVTRTPATLTQQTETLSCDGASGPYTIVAGQFWVRSILTGNRYRNITGGALSTGGTLPVTVTAEGPNDSAAGINYADAAGTLTELDPPIKGVTASNTAPPFSAVRSTPSPALGAGVVTVTGTPPLTATAYDVLITADGQNNTATFRWRANGGAWSDPVAMAASFLIPSTSVTVNFANDAGGANPSFRASDLYSFTAPGSPITQQGVDRESTTALITRCLARWPDLAPGVTVEKRVKWVKEAHASVKRVRVFADTTYPGRFNVIIAGAPGTATLGAPVVTAVQNAIDLLEGVGDISLVAAATILNVTAGGVVEVPAGTLAIVQAAAEVEWATYVNGIDIAGVVRRKELLEILMDAGASDVGPLTLNAVAANLALGATEIAQAVGLTATLTWVEV